MRKSKRLYQTEKGKNFVQIICPNRKNWLGLSISFSFSFFFFLVLRIMIASSMEYEICLKSYIQKEAREKNSTVLLIKEITTLSLSEKWGHKGQVGNQKMGQRVAMVTVIFH